MKRIALRLCVLLVATAAAQTVIAGGAIHFNGQVEGTRETLSGYLEFRQEAGQSDTFRFRTNRGANCIGPLYQKAGVLSEAVLQCSDGRPGIIRLRLYGKIIVSEALLGGRKLILSMPFYEDHRSR